MSNSTSDEREQRLKDNKAIHEIISEWCGEGTIGVMRQKIVKHVATVRKQERTAERKRALDVIKRVPATAAGADAFRKRLIEELYVEAAANETREDKEP